MRNAQRLPERPQMLLHQFGIEAVVTRGDGSMSGKHHFTGNPSHGLIEAETFFLHPAANRFQHRKPTMAFVQVQDPWSDAHGFEGTEPTDSKQQFLADSNARVSSIQA